MGARISILVLALLCATSPTSAASEEIDMLDGGYVTLHGNRDTNFPNGPDWFGSAVAFGDVDGDGLTDFMVSSRNSEGPNDTHPHQQDTYLFFGRPEGAFEPLIDIDAPGAADIVFYGSSSAVGCGDINADGYDDILVAERIDYPRDIAKYYGIVFGRPRAQFQSAYNFSPNTPGYTPAGVRIRGGLLGGVTTDSAGGFGELTYGGIELADLNGDGFLDIVIADFGPPPYNAQHGAVFIIFGRPRHLFPELIDVEANSAYPRPDVSIYGSNADLYPASMAVGDIDGDGIDDLITSTILGNGEDEYSRHAGEVHAWWGKRDWQSFYDTQTDGFDFAIFGIDDVTGFGYRLELADFDGDGRKDIVAGSIDIDIPELREGARRRMGLYRMFFGRPRNEWPRWIPAIEATDVLILGRTCCDVNASNESSQSIDTGNCNGDGYDDLLIGHGFASSAPFGRRGGEAYILLGRPRNQWPPFIDLVDGYDTIVYGAELGDQLGHRVGLADLDGNGYDDMILTAVAADGPDNTIIDGGEVYLIYNDAGSADPPTAGGTPAPPTAQLAFSPNPFSDETLISYATLTGEVVSLSIYDALGRHVTSPVSRGETSPPERTLAWRGVGADGHTLPSGVYFAKLVTTTSVVSRKVVIVR